MHLAQGDLASAEALLAHEQAALRNAAFLAQQAVEKGMKACLVADQADVPRIHDLVALAAALRDPLTVDHAGLRRPTFWAVAGRYQTDGGRARHRGRDCPRRPGAHRRRSRVRTARAANLLR